MPETKITQMRLDQHDRSHITALKRRYGLKTTTDAVRWALHAAVMQIRLGKKSKKPIDL